MTYWTEYTIYINNPDDLLMNFTHQDSSGNPIDIAGWEIKFTVKDKQENGSDIIPETNGTIVSAAEGKFKVYVSRTAISAIDTGGYYFTLKLIDASDIQLTRVKGGFNVEWGF